MIASLIQERARELGFARVGIVPVGPMAHAPHLDHWLEEGRNGLMGYMANHRPIRGDTRRVESWARSIVAVSAPYRDVGPTPEWSERWAQYSVGDDYHDVLWDRLQALAAFIRMETGAEVSARPATDSAPILERNVAIDAGNGWLGKSAMVIDPEWGSYTLLAELFVSIDLEELRADRPDRCGTCTRCIDLCPTGAILGPYQVDGRRCISYLTIETRGAIPREMRPLIGGHLFGCDVCQDVCPWNTKARKQPMEPFAPRAELVAMDAVSILRCSQEDFTRVFNGTAIKRTRRTGLARNAAVVLGNTGDRSWVGELTAALRGHDIALVRGHAAWALGRLGGANARLHLELAHGGEPDAYVREEIRTALGEM